MLWAKLASSIMHVPSIYIAPAVVPALFLVKLDEMIFIFPSLMIAPPKPAVFAMKFELDMRLSWRLMELIAPPFVSAELFIKSDPLTLFASYIAPPLYAELLMKVQFSTRWASCNAPPYVP